MILACPACRTRFQVEDEALRRPGGRLVRCGNCGHGWRHVAEAAASLRVEPAVPEMPEMPAAPERSAALAPERPEPSNWASVATVLLVLLLGVAALAAVVERRQIVALYPAAAHFYARIGLPVAVPAAGNAATAAALKIAHIAASRTAHGLVIEGDILNNGSAASQVPRLRIALQDRNNRELQSEIVDAPEPRVSAGAHLHFSAPFANPNSAATDVEVTFASGAGGARRTEPAPAPANTAFPRASKS
jgi:predicted Zn finger-like uncharacterized protein